MSGLLKRIATGLTLVAVFLTLLWVPALAWGFHGFVLLMAGIGLSEYVGLLEKRKIDSIRVPSLIAFVLMATFRGDTIAQMNGATLAMVIFGVFLLIISSSPSIPSLTGYVAGIVYVPWTALHVSILFEIPELGRGLVLAMVVAVALTDVGAYFVGKGIGRHKLAPVVSPNKTWEGAIGGFVVAGIGMAVLWQLIQTLEWQSFPTWSVVKYVVIGAVLSIASQIGDLAQSALKRDAGVKDSGSIFPGHGGVLDRFDGFLFAAPVLYYIVILMEHHA